MLKYVFTTLNSQLQVINNFKYVKKDIFYTLHKVGEYDLF